MGNRIPPGVPLRAAPPVSPVRAARCVLAAHGTQTSTGVRPHMHAAADADRFDWAPVVITSSAQRDPGGATAVNPMDPGCTALPRGLDGGSPASGDGRSLPAPAVPLCGRPRRDNAEFVIKRRFWQRHVHLQPLGPSVRTKDTDTVLFLELDNFGDIGATPLFPSPLSPLAHVLLPAGALACLWFGARPAAMDVVDGLRNMHVLGAERRALLEQQRLLDARAAALGSDPQALAKLRRESMEIRLRLLLCQEERHHETIDRVVSGALIAPGSLCTGIGTLITPGFLAANTAAITTASNLLTGFVGNGPVALYGVVNAIYSGHRAWVAQQRLNCLKKVNFNAVWHGSADFNAMLQRRQRLLRNVALLKGITSAGIGVSGIFTAVSPFAYAVLLPFALGRAWAEYYGHTRADYSRRLYRGQREDLSTPALLNDLWLCHDTYQALKFLKVHSRRRYPWGVGAPAPFGWIMRGVALLRASQVAEPPSSVEQVVAFMGVYRACEVAWLDRKAQGVADELERVRGTSPRGASPWTRQVRARLSAELQRVRCRRAWAQADAEAISALPPNAALHEEAAEWLQRVVMFFAEHDLFPLLAEVLLTDPLLRDCLVEAAQYGRDTAGKRTVAIDGQRLLQTLRAPTAPWLRRIDFMQRFYQRVERLLMTAVKQHFNEVQRELMDMVTVRAELFDSNAEQAAGFVPLRSVARP